MHAGVLYHRIYTLTLSATSKMQVFFFLMIHSYCTSLHYNTHSLKTDSKSVGWVRELTLLSFVLPSGKALACNKTRTSMRSVTLLISLAVTSSRALLLLAPAQAFCQPRLSGFLSNIFTDMWPYSEYCTS